MTLEQEVLIHQAINDTVEDLKPNGRLTLQGITVEVTQNSLVEVDNLLHEYVEALIQHLDEHSKDSLPLFSLFTVFILCCYLLLVQLPSYTVDYGKDEMAKIRKIYAPEKVSEVVAELELFKFHMTRFNIPAPERLIGETQPEFVLKNLLRMDTLFSLLVSFAEAILCLPRTNPWPKCGASSLRRIKTRLRLHLTNKMLGSLLLIAINGPEVCTEDCHQLIRAAVNPWLNQRKRRKRTSESVLPSRKVFVETGIQFDLDIAPDLQVNETAT